MKTKTKKIRFAIQLVWLKHLNKNFGYRQKRATLSTIHRGCVWWNFFKLFSVSESGMMGYHLVKN